MVLSQTNSLAFEQLIKRHQSRLRLYLRCLSGNRDTADELAQDTFLKVHRALPQFKFQSSFKTWVFSIARNTFLDHARLANNRAQDFESIDSDNFRPDPSKGEKYVAEESIIFSIDLENAMTALSQAEREVIVHCYLADLTMTETAKILNMQLGTVKTHSHRALAKLRTSLAAWKTQDSKNWSVS